MPPNGEEERVGTVSGLRGVMWRLWLSVQQAFRRIRSPAGVVTTDSAPAESCQPLRRLRLTDGVGRTLFEEFAAHRAEDRGDEETGWLLMGLRQKDEALALATLPAGAFRDAGRAHVQFNSAGQAVGSRIVRQADRRLTILGVVHTHPGSLRHPSDGDYQGDSVWVGRLRGGEGVFGIGTADGRVTNGATVGFATQPRPHVQCLGELTFSWYSLRTGARNYEPLPLELTLGPDLARPLHEVWPTLEEEAERLERLYRQQVGLRCEVVEGKAGTALAVTLPLAERGDCVRVLLQSEGAEYFVVRGGDMFAIDRPAENLDRAVYLLLAELADRG